MDPKEDILSIDIEKIIAGKSPKLAQRIPKFLIRYIKRTIHQDEINTILRDHHQTEGAEFASCVLKDLNVGYRVHQTSMADPHGRYIFVSNHPLGGLDGMVLISHIHSMFGSIKVPVNDLLLSLKPFRSIFVPVNKYGKIKHDAAALINEAFESDCPILYFPAGLCSRLIKGKITDLEWKKSFVTKAIESHRDIIPIYFEGRNSMFFYRLAKLRKFLGIKFNIETFYLPDEMFKQKNSIFDVYIGEPIPVSSLSREHSHKEWADIIRGKCYGTNHQTDRS